MNFSELAANERDRLLIEAVDAWQRDEFGQLNFQRIYHHWRGRPDSGDSGMITMVEYARSAWRASFHKDDALDLLRTAAERLLSLQTFTPQNMPSSFGYLPYGYFIAEAMAHTVLAVVAWRDPATHAKAFGHLRQAAHGYQSIWPVGIEHDLTVPPFDQSSLEQADLFKEPKKDILALLSGAFDPCGSTKIAFAPTATTWMILYELLSRMMRNDRRGTKVEMKGLFVGPDAADVEHEVGHVLNVAVRRLDAPITGFYPDPLSLGITFIDKYMRQSMRAAWRCCLFEPPNSGEFSLRIDFHIDQPQVGMIGGPSAGGLIAAMMCAARDEVQLASNISATCSLKLDQTQLAIGNASPLDPQSVSLRKIHGTLAKIREAWLGHGVDEVYLHPDNWDKWDRARQPGPLASKAATLADLINGLNRDRPHWEQIERISEIGHARWQNIIDAQDQPRRGRDQRHRLDLYVPPGLRVEGPPRQGEELPKLEPRAVPTELIVPGAELSEEPLKHVLALALGGVEELDWKLWQIASGTSSTDEVDGDDIFQDANDADDSEAAQDDEQSTAPPGWLRPGCDLLVYDRAGAGKSVLTLKMVDILNDPDRWPTVFGVKQPTLVVRIEGVWPKRDGQLVPVREMVFHEAVSLIGNPRPQQRPGNSQSRYLDETEKEKLREMVDFAFAKQRVVLVVDGFDQFATAAREHIVAEHETRDGRSCRWIVASREHTIATLFRSSERVHDWMRLRIEPFNAGQQDEFFRLAKLEETWREYVDRESMSELLELPLVLDQLREFIEGRIRLARETGRPAEPVAFESISQLSLVTSRLSLDRALEPEKLGELVPPEHLHDQRNAQLRELEHVLSLVAFEMLLRARSEENNEWNGQVLGREAKQAFLQDCRDRYFRPLDLRRLELRRQAAPQLGDERRADELKKTAEQAGETWDWALEVLRAIELYHRAFVEQNEEDILAFRDRKAMEFYAARYLTRYATHWDIFAHYAADKHESRPDDTACAWQRMADGQWSNTWQLAIDMPQEPLPGTTETVYTGAVLDPLTTCRSLSVLFRATLNGERRPTELLWRLWPLFEFDKYRGLDSRYRVSGKLVSGQELADQGLTDELHRLAERKLLRDRDGVTQVRELREACLREFRRSSRELVREFESRFDTVRIVRSGRWSWLRRMLGFKDRVPIPADAVARRRVLAQWQVQSYREKSLTFLQCPPQPWIDDYESNPAGKEDPRINDVIQGHEADSVSPVRMQATPVTRGMFAAFDPHFDQTESIAESLSHVPWQEFPMIRATWFDAWVYCKWLGPDFRLPTEFEWEHAARAGTKTTYHFGDRLSGDLANCNGNYPWPREVEHPEQVCLEGCSPVGLERYPCSPSGLFDVHGNVWEWCFDWRRPGSSRALRGGSWYHFAGHCRSAYRFVFAPVDRSYFIGFRVCRD